MALLVSAIVLCLFLTIICVLGTGSDLKNIKSFKSYPKDLQAKLRNEPSLKDKIPNTSTISTFISNFILFLIIFFIAGIFFRTKSFLNNFMGLFILGLVMNFYDLIILDLLWWRNSKRIRFSMYPDKKLYKNPKEHINSAIRAFIMYLLIALIDGGLLMLF